MNNMENQCKTTKHRDVPSEYIPAVSHYALKIAFQTLKERCDKLQSRLNIVEEQNAKLKELSGRKEFNDKDLSRIDILEKRVDDLSRQKSQLSHHIFMLANENTNLFDTITKLTEEKQLLLDQIRDLDSKLNNLENSDKLTEPLQFLLKENDTTERCSINGFVADSVSDEDEKESLQSIETVKDFSITLVKDEKDLDLLGINNEMKDILDKLNKDKSQLLHQQLALKKVLESMKKICLGLKLLSLCLQRLKAADEEKSDRENDEIKKKFEKLIHYSKELTSFCQEVVKTDNTNELLCPFCNKVFVEDEGYHEYFLNHIQDCSDTDTFLKSFELV